MFWFVPSTHRVVIVALLAIAVIAFVLFWVTLVMARRRGRRAELQLAAHAAIRHGVRIEPYEPPPAPVRGDPPRPEPRKTPPRTRPRDE